MARRTVVYASCKDDTWTYARENRDIDGRSGLVEDGIVDDAALGNQGRYASLAQVIKAIRAEIGNDDVDVVFR